MDVYTVTFIVALGSENEARRAGSFIDELTIEIARAGVHEQHRNDITV